MMKLTDEKIALILRHNVAAARAVLEHDDPSPYPPIDLTHFPECKKRLYLSAVKDLKLNVEGKYMPHEMWFETHWALFPFTNRWCELTTASQRFVEYVHCLCQQMTMVRN